MKKSIIFLILITLAFIGCENSITAPELPTNNRVNINITSTPSDAEIWIRPEVGYPLAYSQLNTPWLFENVPTPIDWIVVLKLEGYKDTTFTITPCKYNYNINLTPYPETYFIGNWKQTYTDNPWYGCPYTEEDNIRLEFLDKHYAEIHYNFTNAEGSLIQWGQGHDWGIYENMIYTFRELNTYFSYYEVTKINDTKFSLRNTESNYYYVYEKITY